MPESEPARRRVDLRVLPSWIQWALALGATAAVVLAAWWAEGDQPLPSWASENLVPGLGVAWLLLAAVALITRWRRR